LRETVLNNFCMKNMESDKIGDLNMDVITYSQLHELVMKLPAGKLSLAYNLLADLSKKKEDKILPQSDFMNLPLNERRRIMSEQAQKMIFHYERDTGDRQEWQTGEFNDEYLSW